MRQQRHRLRAFMSLAAAAILCCGGLVFPGFGVSEHPQAPPTCDEDLAVVRRIVSEDDNGFSLIALDSKLIYWPRDYEASQEASRLVAGKSSDWELADDILHRNADVLRRLEKSLERRDFQFPESRDPVQWIDVITGWRRLTQILSLRAFLRAQRQGAEAGVIDAMKMMRFGQRVQRAQGSLIQWVLASSFKLQGLECIRRLLETGGLSSQRLVALSEELRRYPADREGFAFAARFEYHFLVGQLDKVDRGELDPKMLLLVGEGELSKGKQFDLQRTKRQMATVIRSVIDRVLHQEPTWGLQLAPPDSAEGLALCEQIAEGWRLGLQRGAMEDTALIATRTLLALGAHKQEHGRLAGSLAELVPDYLAEIPIDPFDGKPLRYAPSRKIVYSVGTDMVDRGGSNRRRAASARQDDSEPTFRIEF